MKTGEELGARLVKKAFVCFRKALRTSGCMHFAIMRARTIKTWTFNCGIGYLHKQRKQRKKKAATQNEQSINVALFGLTKAALILR